MHLERPRPDWQRELRRAIQAESPEGAPSPSTFPFRAPPGYLALADANDPSDPILLQVLPDASEDAPPSAGWARDAVGDLDPAHHHAPGLIHKYPGRALIVSTGTCPVHCRYCFRRHFPYEEVRDRGEAAAEAIEADSSIHEVILSGGDPLTLTDADLGARVRRLAAIPHVRRLRVHTRVPVVLPERVTPELIELLATAGVVVWVVVHFNHPRELAPGPVAACRALLGAGLPVLNQSVLLAGVNDDAGVLAELCEGLVDVGVKPYYLHVLDRVAGAERFLVDDDRAVELHAALRARVSGIALPALVRDVPGRPSKTPVLSDPLDLSPETP